MRPRKAEVNSSVFSARLAHGRRAHGRGASWASASRSLNASWSSDDLRRGTTPLGRKTSARFHRWCPVVRSRQSETVPPRQGEMRLLPHCLSVSPARHRNGWRCRPVGSPRRCSQGRHSPFARRLRRRERTAQWAGGQKSAQDHSAPTRATNTIGMLRMKWQKMAAHRLRRHSNRT